MNSLTDLRAMFSTYEPAILALAILCLTVLIQNFLTAPLSFVKEEQIPGMPLKGGHELLSFRAVRTYANSTETLPAFGFALLIAILVTVNANLVNWLACIHVGFRLVFWAVYYSGVGKVAGGPRTLCFIGGLASNIILVIAAIYVLVSG